MIIKDIQSILHRIFPVLAIVTVAVVVYDVPDSRVLTMPKSVLQPEGLCFPRSDRFGQSQWGCPCFLRTCC